MSFWLNSIEAVLLWRMVCLLRCCLPWVSEGAGSCLPVGCMSSQGSWFPRTGPVFVALMHWLWSVVLSIPQCAALPCTPGLRVHSQDDRAGLAPSLSYFVFMYSMSLHISYCSDVIYLQRSAQTLSIWFEFGSCAILFNPLKTR